MSASWETQGVRGPRLLGLVPVENQGHQETQEWKGVRARRPKPRILLRGENHPPLLQDEFIQNIDVEGVDSLQIIEVRGGCESPLMEPLPNYQARSRKQFKLPTLGQVARGRGGEKVDDLAKRKAAGAHVWGGEKTKDPAERRTAGAHVWGGESHDRRGDECPEVRVVWRGAVERPVPAVSHPTRPILAGSPPLEERSWVATQTGRKIQWCSSTLEKISSTPTKKTLGSPTTLEIPTTSLGVPRENDAVPMDLTNRRQPLQEMLRECLMKASPPRLIPSGVSQKRWPTCSPPPLSRDSFMNLPTHDIVQILKSPAVLEEVTPAIHDAMIGVVDDEVMLNTPVTTVDNEGAGLKTSTTTRMCLWSPVEDLMWPVSPPSTRDSRATPIGDPEPLTSPNLTTSSSTVVTPPTRAIIRVAKWVGELGGGSDNNQEMNISVSEENQGDEDSPVKDDVDLAKGIGSTLNTGRYEVEDVNIQTEPNETEDDEMVVDVDEPVTTSKETSGMTIDVDKPIEETKLTRMPESTTEGDVEEKLDVDEPIITSDETPGMTIDVDKQIEETRLTWMPESTTEGDVEEKLDVDEPIITSDETPGMTINVDKQIEETRLTWMPESTTEGDVEEELDVDEPITTSEETSGMTIDVDQQIEETKLTWMPESSTGEYVEEELDEKEMSEDQHELSKDTKVEVETNKDPDQQKKAGDLKTQPVTITPWPSHISSHQGEVEDTEDIFAWPSSPTYQLLPGRSVLASTIPWIEVIPNEDAAETSNMVSEEERKPGIEVTSDDDAATIPWIETIPSHDIVKYEAISDDDASTIPWSEARTNDDVAEAINMVSEEEEKSGIKVISDEDVVKTNRMDSEEEGEREARETGEQDEDSEVETTKAKVRGTYVAIRKLRLQGWKLREKALKQKQKKKKQRTKWIF